MKYGIIQVPVADVRKSPDSHSERLSQALFGSPITFGSVRKGFVFATLPEGYQGWIYLRHLAVKDRKAWESYRRLPKKYIRVDEAFFAGSDSALPLRIFFGTPVAIKTRNSKKIFLHPNGDWYPIAASAVHAPPKKSCAGSAIVKTAVRFVGIPYLWGGITPYGYDCSGLVQMVYRFHGIELPRDSSAQAKVGQKFGREDLRPGDLLFFKGHVAISLGGQAIIHATMSRGMVAIESIDPHDAFYREDLDKGFLFGRRVI